MGSGSSVAAGRALKDAFVESEKSRLVLPESVGSHSSFHTASNPVSAQNSLLELSKDFSTDANIKSEASQHSLISPAPSVEWSGETPNGDPCSSGPEQSSEHDVIVAYSAEPKRDGNLSVVVATPERGRGGKNDKKKRSKSRSKSRERGEPSHLLSPVMRGRKLFDSAWRTIGDKVHLRKHATLTSKELNFSKRCGEWFVHERKAKSTHCTQFLLDECEGCSVRIHDICDTGFVQDCTECSFVIGPTSDSIYIRDCKDCRIIVACRQLRMYGCSNIDVQLYCSTQPTIESCEDLRFSCFHYSYPGLTEQFNLANLSVFENSWSDVYDFTPSSSSYKVVEDGRNFEEFLKTPGDAEVAHSNDVSTPEVPLVVPITMGPLAISKPGGEEMCMVLVLPVSPESTISMLQSSNLYLVRTRPTKLTKKDIQSLFLNIDESPFLKKALCSCSKGPFISAEVRGPNCSQTLQKMATSKGGQASFFVTNSRDSATLFSNTLFSDKADKGHEFDGQHTNGPDTLFSQGNDSSLTSPTSPKSPNGAFSVSLDDSADDLMGGAPTASVHITTPLKSP